MKVSTFNSVGAKLFYYMSALVLITVAGNSFQYIKTFMAYQTQQVQDTIQLQAERTREQFENTIETWRAQIAVALPTMRGADGGKSGTEQLQRFVDSNKEFVAFQLFSAPSSKSTDLTPLGDAFTSNTGDKSFEDKEPAQVGKQIRAVAPKWLKTQIPKMKKGNNVTIESLAKSVKLPVMAMAVRFDVAGSPTVLWAILSTWQNNLINSLPQSQFLSSVVIDGKGRIFTASDLSQMVQRSLFTSKQLVKSATAGSSPSGFENEYKDAKGHRRLGAFARVPRYDLAVLVEQDAEQAYQALRKNLLSTALWAALFILVAVMFSFFGAAGITKGLRAVTYATGRIAAGDFKYQVPQASSDEVGMLGEAVNHMSRKIVDLMQSQVDKARFEKELETAKIVQQTFFPKEGIKKAPTTVTGFFEPASECGGDLWGHYTISDGVEFVFIADAMGHGAPAALVTAMAYSTTMTVADIIKHDPNSLKDSPAKVLERLNRIIYEAVRGTISMTFFASVIDTKTGKLTFANAGHNFPVIVPLNPGDPRSGKPSKQAARTGGIQPISLKLMGTPLGMDPLTTYKEQTVDLKAGDKIFYFTDGLIECSNPKGEVWGRKFLIEQVAEGAKLDAEEMKNDVVGKAFKFFGGKPLDDDVTIVVAELARDWQPQTSAEPAKTVDAAPPAPAKTPAPAPVPQEAVSFSLNDERLDALSEPLPSLSMPPQSMPPMPLSRASMAPESMPPVSMPPMSIPPARTKPPKPAAKAAPPRPKAPEPLADPVSMPPIGVIEMVVKPVPQPAPQPQPAPRPAPQATAAKPAPGKGGKYKLKLPSTG